jgi:RNA polymerase sigma-70 factor (ECF subfamily)
MKTKLLYALAASLIAINAGADEMTLDSAPPVVVRSVPAAGSTDVDPGLSEIQVTFSKTMMDGSWSWSTWGQENFPETTGKTHYLADGRTCVLPVKLQPGKFYASWLNSDKYGNFKDKSGQSSVPYLLTFSTAKGKGDRAPQAETKAAESKSASPNPFLGLLNEDQKRVLAWTDRQFRNFFDGRTFEGWTEKERTDLETKLIDALSGPVSRDYYAAIGSLAALKSKKAGPVLLAKAADRAEKDNRDRWMAIRALGLLGDKSVTPELIHLVYHGNSNTRWWAQISLVRLTGKNFGSDWKAWGKWWNESGEKPAWNSEIVRWYKDQAEADKLADDIAERDKKFLGGI